MKRLLIFLLSLVLLACMPTPEQDVVINKVEGYLEETIAETTPVPVYATAQTDSAQPDGAPLASDAPAVTLRSILNAPEHCVDSAEGKVFGGTLQVQIDADVEVPNVSAVPVFTVREKLFSAEEKARMTKLVLGDGPYCNFNLERYYKDSDKANIDEELKRIQELDDRIFGENFPYDEYRKGYEHNLNNYLESYNSLPEPGPMQPWTGSFNAEHLAVADENNNTVSFDKGAFYLHNSVSDSTIAFNAKRMPETDEERQAADAAVAVYSSLSEIPFRVTGIVGDSEGFNELYEGVAKRPIEQYSVSLAPVFADIPAYSYSAYHGSDTGQQAAGVLSDDYDNPVRPMYVDALVENGKVVALNWYNVYEIVGTENENVTLLPFETVLEKFKKQVYYSIYFDPPEAGEPEGTMVMVVEQIRLSYMRVKKPDSDECYLLPVWDFMGYDYNPAYKHDAHDLIGTKSWFSHQSLLTINAIDGSIIDRNKGY